MKGAYFTFWLAVATEAPRLLKKPVSLSTSYKSLQPRRNSATSMLPACHAQPSYVMTRYVCCMAVNINCVHLCVQCACPVACWQANTFMCS